MPTYPVAIAGAGPVGLTLALALARHGVPCVLLEEDGTVNEGSRALGMSRRTQDIWAALGLGDAVQAKGRPWYGGWTYYRDKLVLDYRIPHEPALRHPPMLNLQQSDAERFLVTRIGQTPLVDLRWGNRVTGVESAADSVMLQIEGELGASTLRCQCLVACDGGRSRVRSALGLQMEGALGEAQYLIVDIEIAMPLEMGRRAWFDPAYSRGTTVLMHGQPDDIWRIDWQVAPGEDLESSTALESVVARVTAHLSMIGVDAPWRVAWISAYRAHARTLPEYRQGRVLLAGDAAHQIPIFGIRGLNSGIEDAWNLAWKLAFVLDGRAPARLLDTYSTERVGAARENLRLANRALRFMTPPTRGWRLMRDAILSLGITQEAVRSLINPRQATLVPLLGSPLSSAADGDALGGPGPGDVMPNVRVALRALDGWTPSSLHEALGSGFALLVLGDAGRPLRVEGARVVAEAMREDGVGDVFDRDGGLAALLCPASGAVYLVRPDHHVAASWRAFDAAEVARALAVATGHRCAPVAVAAQ